MNEKLNVTYPYSQIDLEWKRLYMLAGVYIVISLAGTFTDVIIGNISGGDFTRIRTVSN